MRGGWREGESGIGRREGRNEQGSGGGKRERREIETELLREEGEKRGDGEEREREK